jgi:hypothetical protein
LFGMVIGFGIFTAKEGKLGVLSSALAALLI